MFHNILVPLDGSEYALSALPYAEGLAKVEGARITLISVLMRSERPSAVHVERLDEQSRERLETELATTAERVRARGVKQVEVAVRLGEPAHQITEAAATEGVDLIVMSTHGTGATGHYALGSVALKVLMTAACPVFLVRIPGQGTTASAA